MIAGKFCLAAVAVFMIAMSAMGDGHGEFGQVARGVLSRFAGEDVASRFCFERMEEDEPQAEVSARSAAGRRCASSSVRALIHPLVCEGLILGLMGWTF